MKKVLITGANSYIGTSFEDYVRKNYRLELEVATIGTIDGNWRQANFGLYDIVYLSLIHI